MSQVEATLESLFSSTRGTGSSSLVAVGWKGTHTAHIPDPESHPTLPGYNIPFLHPHRVPCAVVSIF